MAKAKKFNVKTLEKLAGNGLNYDQIAHNLGVHPTTLYKHIREDGEYISHAIERGRAKSIAQVANKVYEMSMEGNFPAAKFFLTNRAKEEWQDKRVEEHKGGDITVNLESGRPKDD